jgi:hypothetical protein
MTVRERTNIESRYGGYLASPLVVAVPLKQWQQPRGPAVISLRPGTEASGSSQRLGRALYTAREDNDGRTHVLRDVC